MADFQVSDVLEYATNAPVQKLTHQQLERVLDVVRTEFSKGGPTGNGQVEVRVGAVWERKDYPTIGSVSKEVSPGTSYRRSDFDEQIFISIGVLAPRSWLSHPLEDVVATAKAQDESHLQHEVEKARQAKIQKLAALVAEAQKLEAEING